MPAKSDPATSSIIDVVSRFVYVGDTFTVSSSFISPPNLRFFFFDIRRRVLSPILFCWTSGSLAGQIYEQHPHSIHKLTLSLMSFSTSFALSARPYSAGSSLYGQYAEHCPQRMQLVSFGFKGSIFVEGKNCVVVFNNRRIR